MGKSRKGGSSRRGSAMDLMELEDNASVASSVMSFKTAKDEFDGDGDQFQQLLDDTFEKRGSTREKALEGLISILLEDVHEEECESNEATIVGRCINGIRKGGSTEATLSAQLLSLHFITQPQPTERLLRDVLPELTKAATHGSGEEVEAIVEALAMATFVAAEDDESTTEVMGTLQTLWRKGDAGARAAALRGWSLLFTSLNQLPSSSRVEGLLAALADLLHSNRDLEVRSAAGEAVTLLYSSCGLPEGLPEDEGEEDEEEDGEDEEEGSVSVSSKGGSGLHEVVGRMKDLATHNRGDALRSSKRAKASMRTTFRQLLGAMGGGKVQQVKIKLQHGDTLVVDTLPGLVMLNAFKRCLAGGFQVHLQANPLLHDVFGFTPAAERGPRLSSLEKRMFRSPSSQQSKDRVAERKGQRAHKSRQSVVSFGGDDY